MHPSFRKLLKDKTNEATDKIVWNEGDEPDFDESDLDPIGYEEPPTITE